MKKWMVGRFTIVLVTALLVGVTSVSQDKAGANNTATTASKQEAALPAALPIANQPVQRGEFLKLVVATLEMALEEAAGSGYEVYAKAARDHQLYVETDFPNSSQSLSKPITRKEVARVIVRATGGNTQEDDKWMYLATKSGLLTGLGKGELGEDKTITQAQADKIMERIRTLNAGGQLEADKYAVSSAELAWHKTNIFTVMPEIFVTREEHYKGKTIEELWREDLMVIETKNGLYKGQLDALIAIDLEDPNDPNLKLLDPIQELKIDFHGARINNVPVDNYPITDWKKSYILLFKGRTIYNKDKTKFATYQHGPLTAIHGIEPPDIQLFRQKKVLNQAASLYRKEANDVEAYIIPKEGWIQEKERQIYITIRTPALSEWVGGIENKLIRVDGPKYIKD
ncbi:hypothetical protein [Paenibacillus fonticola]|uniref:hypothetical protein n=1 Tax=Paenibacillus fonticola TaxID=379896 RepID=UPI00035CD17D|nr:hypothetical protein [Paenibacillus fonticola]